MVAGTDGAGPAQATPRSGLAAGQGDGHPHGGVRPVVARQVRDQAGAGGEEAEGGAAGEAEAQGAAEGGEVVLAVGYAGDDGGVVERPRLAVGGRRRAVAELEVERRSLPRVVEVGEVALQRIDEV